MLTLEHLVSFTQVKHYSDYLQ